jgi:glycosyltransferase involved in cell wall biosynthesis
MKIVQVVPSFTLGGAEVFALQLAEAQRAAGHDVLVIVLRDEGPLRNRLTEDSLARVRVVEKRGRYDLTVLPRLVSVLRAWSPDVVHTHLFTGLAWGTVAARAAGVPTVVYTEHACHPDDVRWLKHVRRLLSYSLTAVVGCSEAATEAVRSRREAPGCPTRTIANGVSLKGRPRARLSGEGPLHVGTVGRLTPIKGQRDLIEAVALLAERGVDVRCTIVGGGELASDLAAQAAGRGVADRVALPGPSDHVADWMASFDLFCLPSLSEALPITLLEACAAGLPLLVTTGGGGPTLLAAGAGGEAVPPGDPAALADAIARHAARSPDARRALGEASLAAVAPFDIGASASAYLALYAGRLPADEGAVAG